MQLLFGFLLFCLFVYFVLQLIISIINIIYSLITGSIDDLISIDDLF